MLPCEESWAYSGNDTFIFCPASADGKDEFYPTIGQFVTGGDGAKGGGDSRNMGRAELPESVNGSAMSFRTKPSVRCDLLTVCWALSDSGSTVMQFLHKPDEPCAHPPAQARATLTRLYALDATTLGDLCARLARLKVSDLRFWGAGDDCELCTFLRRLSEDPADIAASACSSEAASNSASAVA